MDNKTSSGRWPFLALVAGGLFFYVFVLAARVAPPGHDALESMCAQYFAFNTTVHGEWLVKWMPSVSFGTAGLSLGVSTIYYNCINLIAFVFGRLGATPFNFYYVHAAGWIFSDVLLLVGTWLLCRRLYRSVATAFFVTAAVVVPCVVLEQPLFPCNMFCAMPLVLYLLHAAVETRSPAKLLWGLLFMLYTSVNVVMYSAVIQLLGYVAYFAAYFLVTKTSPRPLAKALCGSKTALAVLFLIACGAGLLLYSMLYNLNFAELSAPGRAEGGGTTLETFNTYGGFLGAIKYLDYFAGVNSFTSDIHVFHGLLVAMLLPFSLVRLPREAVPFLVVTLLLFCFSLGAYFHLSTVLWYGFPGMKFYRHIGYVAPMAAFFSCFVAGYGFERVRFRLAQQRPMPGSSLALLSMGLVFCYLLAMDKMSGVFGQIERHTQARLVFVTAVIALVALALLFMRTRPKSGRVLLVALLCLHFADVAHYRASIFAERGWRLSTAELSLWDGTPASFEPTRFGGYFDTERGRLLQKHIESTRPYAYYSSISQWLNHEPVEHNIRSLEAERISAPLLALVTAEAPPGLKRAVGVEAPKIRFFAQAQCATPASALASITAPDYAGDVLFVDDRAQRCGKEVAGAPDLPVAYTMPAFTPNRLTIALQRPLPAPAWFSYADSWNPLWHARVDGIEQPVVVANGCFKAVHLPAGASTLTLECRSELLDFAALVHRVLSAFLCGFVLREFWRILRRPPIAG